MLSSSAIVVFSAIFGCVNAHSVILNAQGETGSAASVGFKVIPDLARNCTTISPCQQDATLIRDQEIKDNVVGPCGRTELGGNIDIGTETAAAEAAKTITDVTAGGTLTMTIHQVNADGAGPFFCSVDETGNGGAFKDVPVTENVPGTNGLSQAKTQQFQVKVTMPQDLNCSGGSTGDLCLFRSRNAAHAGPFGGCFAVRQTGKAAGGNTGGNNAAGGKNNANKNKAAKNNTANKNNAANKNKAAKNNNNAAANNRKNRV